MKYSEVVVLDDDVGNDLEEWIAEEDRKKPGFRKEVEAAVESRRLMRKLAEAREQAGLTQTEVAKRMGTSQSAVARLEAGEAEPLITTLVRYGKAVGKNLIPG